MAVSHPEDVPTIDVIPLFEQLEDLQNSVDVLEEMIKIPEVQARLKATGGKMEVMLGYSDSSKAAGPTSATLPCTPRRSASPSGPNRTTST